MQCRQKPQWWQGNVYFRLGEKSCPSELSRCLNCILNQWGGVVPIHVEDHCDLLLVVLITGILLMHPGDELVICHGLGVEQPLGQDCW